MNRSKEFNMYISSRSRYSLSSKGLGCPWIPTAWYQMVLKMVPCYLLSAEVSGEGELGPLKSILCIFKALNWTRALTIEATPSLEGMTTPEPRLLNEYRCHRCLHCDVSLSSTRSAEKVVGHWNQAVYLCLMRGKEGMRTWQALCSQALKINLVAKGQRY